jgi:hypothetical protein
MSVLMTMRVQGDTDRLRDFLQREADRLRQIRDQAHAAGCLPSSASSRAMPSSRA